MEERELHDMTNRVARVRISKGLLAQLIFPPGTIIVGVHEEDQSHYRMPNIEFGIRHPMLKEVDDGVASPEIELHTFHGSSGITVSFPKDAMEADTNVRDIG